MLQLQQARRPCAGAGEIGKSLVWLRLEISGQSGDLSIA